MFPLGIFQLDVPANAKVLHTPPLRFIAYAEKNRAVHSGCLSRYGGLALHALHSHRVEFFILYANE